MEAPLAPPEQPPTGPRPDPLAGDGRSDEELMQRVQAGDPAAYQALFQRHQARIFSYLSRKTRDPQAAADLYQETFLKVYRARDSWAPDRPFRPWLFGIAANAARDRARRQQRRPQEVEIADWEGATRDHPDARLGLEAAIAALPDTLRDAFLLGVVEGFDHREVAGLLDISPDNARARISRARAFLRQQLEGEA